MLRRSAEEVAHRSVVAAVVAIMAAEGVVEVSAVVDVSRMQQMRV